MPKLVTAGMIVMAAAEQFEMSSELIEFLLAKIDEALREAFERGKSKSN